MRTQADWSISGNEAWLVSSGSPLVEVSRSSFRKLVRLAYGSWPVMLRTINRTQAAVGKKCNSLLLGSAQGRIVLMEGPEQILRLSPHAQQVR
jgi:hypothetical protein